MNRLKGEDIRIVRSRERVKNAFIVLLNKKAFRDISVKEIITTADVNRSTFYHHFEDKWDLRDQFIQEALRDFMRAFNEFDFSVPINVENLCKFTEKGVREVYFNLENYKLLFNPNLEIDILQEISGIFYTFMMQWIGQQPMNFKSYYSPELFSEIYSASAVATLKLAFREDRKKIDTNLEPQYIMQMIRNHLERGFFKTFIEC